jgi:serine/threonine protein kinase
VDARTDVYALGVIAYHMLSGALPFASTNHADLVCQILGREALPLEQRVPELPRGLVAVIAKAMAPEADERFATMAALARALEPFADGMTFAPTGESEFTRDPPQVMRAQPAPGNASHEPVAAKQRVLAAEQTPLVAESGYQQLRGSSLSKRAQRALALAAISVAAPALVILGYNAAAHRGETHNALPVSPHDAASARPSSSTSAAGVAPRAFAAPQAPVDDSPSLDDALPATRPTSLPMHDERHAPGATARAPVTADWQTPAAAPEQPTRPETPAAPDNPRVTNGARKATRASARTSIGSASRAVRAAALRHEDPIQWRGQPAPSEPASRGTGTTPEIRGVDFH